MNGSSEVLWRVTRDDREVRCEMEPSLSPVSEGGYLLLFVDGELTNCGFHSDRQSLLDTATDLHEALRNIVWDDRVEATSFPA